MLGMSGDDDEQPASRRAGVCHCVSGMFSHFSLLSLECKLT